MTIERRVISATDNPIKVIRRADEPARIVGYGAVFYNGSEGTEFLIFDDFVERIMPGAFDQAIREDDVRGLFNHDPDHVLGRTTVDTMKLSVDQRGLLYDIELPDTSIAGDLIKSIERGDVSGSSFSFQITEQVFRQVDGLDIREILGVKLFDTGPVTFPSYKATSTGVRALSEADSHEAKAALKAHQAQQQSARAEITRTKTTTRARVVELGL